VHPPMGQVARDFFVPALPTGAPLAEVMLLIIAIVGTTAAVAVVLPAELRDRQAHHRALHPL